MIPCSWKETFGIECMMCGFQRAINLLFEGKVIDSIYMFPAAIPLIITFLLLIIHLIFRLRNGARNITYLFTFSAILILVNFSIKAGELLTH